MRRDKIWWIGMLVLLFLACQQDPYGESDEILSEGEENVRVSFTISLASGMKLDSEIVPMNSSQTGEDTVFTRISNEYKAIVVKKIDTRWIIDRIVSSNLGIGSAWSEIQLKRGSVFKSLQLELRPGTYRLILFLNPDSGIWNEALKSGMVVENEEGTIAPPQVLKYRIGDSGYPNAGLRMLNRELFAGSADFVVKKNNQLNQDPYKNVHSIQASRKVACFRIVLKENPEAHQFGPTEQRFTAIFTAADGKYFPDGLDIWGNAWYDKTNPCRSMGVCMICRYPRGRTDYLVSSWTGVTVFSPYYIVEDRNEDLPYTISDIDIHGQSGEPYQIFKCPQGYTTSRVFKTSYIDGIVLRPTTEIFKDETTNTGVYLEEVNEDTGSLFGPFMEWNNKY